MADLLVNPNGTSTDITIPANGTFAVWSLGSYQVYTVSTSVNGISQALLRNDVAAGAAQLQSGVLSTTAATVIRIVSTSGVVYYAVNQASATANAAQVANVRTERQDSGSQDAPATLNATGTLFGGAILNGIVTSTGGVFTGTLDIGSVMDTVSNFAIGDYFDWSLLSLSANIVTVAAGASGHTLVGLATVAANSQGRFRTRKTAAATFVTTRIA